MTDAHVLAGLLLALGSSAGWSALDAIRKRLAADLSPPAILLGLAALQIPVHAALLAVRGLPEVDPVFGLWVALGAAVGLAANLLLIRAVTLSPLSLTIPFLSFTPVATVATGWLLLGQTPGASGAGGVVCVVAGALLLAGGPGGSLRRPLEGLLREPGSRLALLVALCFAAGNAIDRRAVLHASEPAYALALSVALTSALVPLRAVRRELRPGRGLRWLLAGGLVAGAALLLQLFAFRFLFVAYVDAVKRAAGNVFAIVLGLLFFSEREPGRRLVAAALMGAGVAMIVLG